MPNIRSKLPARVIDYTLNSLQPVSKTNAFAVTNLLPPFEQLFPCEPGLASPRLVFCTRTFVDRRHVFLWPEALHVASSSLVFYLVLFQDKNICVLDVSGVFNCTISAVVITIRSHLPWASHLHLALIVVQH